MVAAGNWKSSKFFLLASLTLPIYLLLFLLVCFCIFVLAVLLNLVWDLCSIAVYSLYR